MNDDGTLSSAKSCPFCGCKRIGFRQNLYWNNYQMDCYECGVTMSGRNKDECIKKWNKRKGNNDGKRI